MKRNDPSCAFQFQAVECAAVSLASRRRRWNLVLAGGLAPILLAGCSTLNLLGGKLPGDDEEDLGLVTHSYPGWDGKAKETLDRIPTAEKKQAPTTPTGAPPAAATPASPGAPANAAQPAPASNATTTVTHEQPTVANPAATTATPPPATTTPSPTPAPPAQLAAAQTAAPPVAAAANALASATAAALVPPTHQHPLAVAGAESAPVKPATTTKDVNQDVAPAERLTALFKQRSDFLATLKAEVERRRWSPEEADQLRRLEQELRLVHLASENPDEAVRQIEALDGTEREAFAHLLMGLATWMNADEARRPTLRNAKILREIRDAAAQLAAASKLDVRNLAFCEKVESYGWYTEFKNNHFKPKQQVILYAEVENFTAQKIAEDSYETELQGSYQIFDGRGNLVDERQLLRDKEICRNYRRDYFLAQLIYLPDGLAPGTYRLELTVEDIKGSALRQDSTERKGEPARKDATSKSLAAQPPAASGSNAYKGRKLGEATIEFTIK